MATLVMKLKTNSEFFGEGTTEVAFKGINEPLTSDDLTELFIRFAQTCGYAEISIATSLVGKGSERLPPDMV